MNGLWDNRKGTTLVEILVVMVILLVGIMTVIQMFPTGFRVVRAAESQTIATKLAQAEVERWKNMPGNLPDGILPIDSSGNVLNDQYPGPQFDGFMEPAVAGLFEAGNAINYRYVENEPVGRISSGAYFTSGDYFDSGNTTVYGWRYLLGICPIETNGLSVKSGNLLRRVGDSDSLIYLRPGQYGVDYVLDTSGGSPAFYVSLSYDTNPDHVYYISYSYWIGKSSGEWALISKRDQVVRPDANGDWVAVPISVPSTYSGYVVTGVEENTDSCARGFVQVTPVPTEPKDWWDDPSDPSRDDPYEFALVDPILGIVVLDPRASNASEYTARGVRPITARISYRVYDPRIIREDKVVPAPNEDPDVHGNNQNTAIKLALRFILNAGNPDSIVDGDPTDNPDEPTFEGLVKTQLGMALTSKDDLVVKQSVLIIDLKTGLRVEIPPDTATFHAIDYKAGVVHLPKTANLIDWYWPKSAVTPEPPVFENVTLKDRHLRFFYRADGDWSVLCQKAYSYYLREWDTPVVDYWHFKLLAPAGGPYTLLFARCESGKSVTVSYTYTTHPDDVSHSVVGKTFKLSDDWVLDTGSKCSYVTLDVPAGATIDPNARIVVVGASFRARTIWRDGTHWRYVDIDTNLTRNSSP